MDRTISLLVKFAALDKLTQPLKKIGIGSRGAARDIAATTRELAALERAQGKIAGLKSLRAGLDDTHGKIDETRRRIRGLREQIAQTDAPTKRLTNSLAAAERQEARLVATTTKQSSKLQTLQAELKEAGVDTGRLGDAELKLASRMEQVNGVLSRQKAKLDAVAASRRRSERLSGIGSKLQGAGAGASVTGVAIGAPLVDATGDARAFNSVMTDVGIKTGMVARETAKIGRNIRGLAPDVAQLPDALAGAFSTLAGLGLDTGVSEKLLRPIGRAATGLESDINDLAKVSYANFTNLKVPIKETELALDAMAMAGNRGGFEIKDMAEHFPTLTGRLQALGQKGVPAVADLAAALQAAFIDTQDGAAAATNIENLLAKMNSKETIQNFSKFGVDLPKALKKAYAEGKTPLEAIAELTKKAAGGDMSKLTFLFGDMQAQSGVLALIQHMKEYQTIRAQAMAGGGTVDTAFTRRMSEDDATKLAKFNAQISNLKINIGQNLLPAVNNVMVKVGQLADRFGAWSAANPGTAATITKVVAALAALLVVFGALAIIGGTITAGLGVLMPVLGGIWTALTFGFGVIGSILGAIAGVVGLPFLAVAAIAAGLAVAGVLIYKYWDQIKSAFSTGLSWFVGLHVQMAEIGVNLVRGIINGIGSMFGALKRKIVALGQNAVGWFKGVLGIHSPSRVFMQLGGHMTGGLADGIDRGAGVPLERIRALASSAARNAAAIAGSMAVGTVPATAVTGAAASPPAGRASTHYHQHDYHFTVQGGAGADARAQAREIWEEIKRLQAIDATASYEED